jgi:hypothetical protein
LRSAACITQPSKPLMNNKFNASGLNLDINTASVRNRCKTNHGRNWKWNPVWLNSLVKCL